MGMQSRTGAKRVSGESHISNVQSTGLCVCLQNWSQAIKEDNSGTFDLSFVSKAQTLEMFEICHFIWLHYLTCKPNSTTASGHVKVKLHCNTN